LLKGMDIGPSRTKWWGIDRHIVIYYTNADCSELYFVTSVPEPAEWVTRESWSAKGDVKELRKAYEGFHPDVRAVLEACPDCHKWAILEREPLERWSEGRVVLLGDAAHPMTPYMAERRQSKTRLCSRDVSQKLAAKIFLERSSDLKRTANRALRAFKQSPAPIPG
jgi:salicylate hydroxylase/6-hydroxynicotinate 3-monooxygenase